LIFGSVLVVVSASYAQAVHHGPYLTNVTQTDITVSWVTDALSNSTVYYAPASNPSAVLTVGSSRLVYLHHVHLSGLEPDTLYSYHVVSRDLFGRTQFVSPVSTFRTAVRPGETFRFVLKAETHNPGFRGQEAFTKIIENFEPNVIVDPGDHVDDGYKLDQWQEHYRDGDDFLIQIPVIHAWGNHDAAYLGVPQALFDLPGNERWFATTFGNTLFISLDTNSPDTFFNIDEQKRFLEQALQEATDGVGDPAFIVVLHHLIPYGAGPHQIDPFTFLARLELVPLYERYGVDLVLTGHEKLYIHSSKEGVHYFSVCTGTEPRAISNKSKHVLVVESSHSILEVEVGGAGIAFWAKDLTGRVIEEGFIMDNPGEPPQLSQE
jgi:hypothetical protein